MVERNCIFVSSCLRADTYTRIYIYVCIYSLSGIAHAEDFISTSKYFLFFMVRFVFLFFPKATAKGDVRLSCLLIRVRYATTVGRKSPRIVNNTRDGGIYGIT